MNDDLEEIARELAQLRPSKPAPQLNRRIELELDEGDDDRSLSTPPVAWFRWLPLAAAAVLIAAVTVTAMLGIISRSSRDNAASFASTAPQDRESDSSAPAKSGFHRIRNANYLIDAEDNGLLFPSASVPFRKVTWQFVSASEWRDDRDNATVQVLIPREETMLIPVTVH